MSKKKVSTASSAIQVRRTERRPEGARAPNWFNHGDVELTPESLVASVMSMVNRAHEESAVAIEDLDDYVQTKGLSLLARIEVGEALLRGVEIKAIAEVFVQYAVRFSLALDEEQTLRFAQLRGIAEGIADGHFSFAEIGQRERLQAVVHSLGGFGRGDELHPALVCLRELSEALAWIADHERLVSPRAALAESAHTIVASIHSAYGSEMARAFVADLRSLRPRAPKKASRRAA